jgi:elongation factor G
VLEPIVDIEVTMPEPAMGDIIGDLSSRRGQVHGSRPIAGDAVVVAGQVPLAELNDYQSRLNAIAGGHGNYSIQLSHYAPVPAAMQESLVAQHKSRTNAALP